MLDVFILVLCVIWTAFLSYAVGYHQGSNDGFWEGFEQVYSSAHEEGQTRQEEGQTRRSDEGKV